MFDIYELYNNQSSASSLNVIRSLCLHTRKQPSSINTHKPFGSVTKLSYLETCNTAHRKLQHDDDVNTDAVLENYFHCKSNFLCWQYQVKSFYLFNNDYDAFHHFFFQ